MEPDGGGTQSSSVWCIHPARLGRGVSAGIASGQSAAAFNAPYAFVQEDGHESAEQESPTEVAFAQEIVHHKE